MSALLLFALACSDGKVDTPSGGHETGDSGPGETGDSGDTGAAADPLEAWESAFGLDMVAVEPGTFLMGSPIEEVGRWVPEELGGDGTDREVQHEVTLTHTTYVGRTEVTQDLYTSVMGTNPSTYVDCGGDCPVEDLIWHEAAAFANALSALAGVEACYTCEGEGVETRCSEAIPPYDCAGYRLPTEAEWEYVARAGETAAFPGGGNLLPDTEMDCEAGLALDDGETLADLMWYCANAEDTSHPIGQMPPNGLGLLDVQGNIHEWTTDWYQDDWYTDAAYVNVDPVGPAESAETVEKVRRGGAYAHEPRRVRFAYRGWHDPAESTEQVGMRLFRAGQ